MKRLRCNGRRRSGKQYWYKGPVREARWCERWGGFAFSCLVLPLLVLSCLVLPPQGNVNVDEHVDVVVRGILLC